MIFPKLRCAQSQRSYDQTVSPELYSLDIGPKTCRISLAPYHEEVTTIRSDPGLRFVRTRTGGEGKASAHHAMGVSKTSMDITGGDKRLHGDIRLPNHQIIGAGRGHRRRVVPIC